MRWVKPRAVFDGDILREDLIVAIEQEIVTELREVGQLEPGIVVEAIDAVLAPGLFDVQVNGGGGVMLNNNPTREGVRAIAQAHRSVGTAFILPTVITDRPDVIESAADAVLAEHNKNGVLGIHIEGPHIHPAQKGTHNPEFIRSFDTRMLTLLERLRNHKLPVLLTVAPELMESGQIAKLVKMGVIVSAGHSTASCEQTELALAEGLAGFTHLFNGMPQMTSRVPGIVAAALNSTAFCGIIADGHHVDDRMVELAFRARPKKDRMVLVSDAMSTIAGPDHFELYGETIHVEGGKLVNALGSLAGAHTDLQSSVLRLVHNVGLSTCDALNAATTAPRQFMALPSQSVQGSPLAELSVLSLPR